MHVFPVTIVTSETDSYQFLDEKATSKRPTIQIQTHAKTACWQRKEQYRFSIQWHGPFAKTRGHFPAVNVHGPLTKRSVMHLFA